MRLEALASAAALLATVAGCSSGNAPSETPTATIGGSPSATPSSTASASRSASPSVSPSATPTTAKPTTEATSGPVDPTVAGTVATNLTTPWDIAVLPSGEKLLSERDTGRIKLINTKNRVSTVGTVPGVVHEGEGGLLGLALSPSYDKNRLVYAYFTTSSDNRIARMTYSGGDLGSPQVVLDGIPRGDEHHNGGRIRFGPDGYLYVGTGDAYESSNAPDKHSLGGKILRITADGKAAPGNPFGNEVWSYGHRNVEGLAFDPAGRLWASEFGNKGADELNLIQKGGNYGWPSLEGKGGTSDGYVDPVVEWPIEECSPSGIAYKNGAIWMAALRGQRLWRIRLDGSRVVGSPTAYFVERYGRFRTVNNAPDGSLWLATSNTDGRVTPRSGDDRILRITLG